MIIFLLISVVLACTNPVLRREIRELSFEERTRFFSAVDELHRRNDTTKLTRHERFSEIHYDNRLYSHDIPPFLPWHRVYLQEYENALKEIDPSIVLPYWDWTIDAQAPHNSLILTDEFIGGNGDAKNDYCLKDGPFKNWTLNYPEADNHCLRRSYDKGDKITPFGIPEQILLYMNEPTFSKFSFLFEEKHGYPHLFIGGDHGDFAPLWSSNDPLFLLHHTFVDLIWYHWQQRHPGSYPYEGGYYEKNVGLKDKLVPYPDTVKSTLSTTQGRYCYSYPEYPRASYTPNNEKQSHLKSLFESNPFVNGPLKNVTMSEALQILPTMINNSTSTKKTTASLEISGPFTDEWIVKFDFNLKKFKAHAADSEKLIYLLNQLPNFVSISQLSELTY